MDAFGFDWKSSCLYILTMKNDIAYARWRFWINFCDRLDSPYFRWLSHSLHTPARVLLSMTYKTTTQQHNCLPWFVIIPLHATAPSPTENRPSRSQWKHIKSPSHEHRPYMESRQPQHQALAPLSTPTSIRSPCCSSSASLSISTDSSTQIPLSSPPISSPCP